MFYCNDCAKESGWIYNAPTQSYGPCEMCKKVGICNDVPHPSSSILKQYPELQDWGDPIVICKVAEILELSDDQKRLMFALSASHKTREQLDQDVENALNKQKKD